MEEGRVRRSGRVLVEREAREGVREGCRGERGRDEAGLARGSIIFVRKEGGRKGGWKREGEMWWSGGVNEFRPLSLLFLLSFFLFLCSLLLVLLQRAFCKERTVLGLESLCKVFSSQSASAPSPPPFSLCRRSLLVYLSPFSLNPRSNRPSKVYMISKIKI